MRYVLLLLLAASLIGCSESIKLRNASTGQTAACGPYMLDAVGSNSEEQREARCISDYQRQGFERMP